MINLKLAQYNEKGEFEKFLELGQDFLYGGGCIRFFHGVDPLAGYAEPCTFCDIQRGMLLKDEKDPFNRFKGLFDGRTYGDGMFVLINCNKSIAEDNFVEGYDLDNDSYFEGLSQKIYFSDNSNFKVIGNIHENPELWSKIK